MGGFEDPSRDVLLARRRVTRDRLDDPADASTDALAALAELDASIRAHDDRRRAAELESLVSIHGVLADLRGAQTPLELIDAAPGALIAGTDFTRAMVSRVQDGTWDP